MARDDAWLLCIDCEDENGLDALQTDTSHLDIAPDIRNRTSTVNVMEVVMGSRSAGGI
jgi:hypothetical protein